MISFDVSRRAMRAILHGILGGGVALACGGADPQGAASVDALTTKVEIAEFTGGDALRCVFSAPGLELCSWRIVEGDPAWAALAEGSADGGDLNLVCELPLDGSPRADGSCRAHARSASATAGGGTLPPVGAAGSLESQRDAERRLGEALSVREISHLVGDAPERCRTGAEVQTCEWSVAEGAGGYGLLAALVDDAGSGSVVRLRCVVPLDGEARAADSCDAAWADADPAGSDLP
jgi:hypothetical protein